MEGKIVITGNELGDILNQHFKNKDFIVAVDKIIDGGKGKEIEFMAGGIYQIELAVFDKRI